MNQFGSQNMVSSLKKVLMKKPDKFMSKADYKKWNYQGNLNQKLIDNNYNDFLQIIINAKVKIIYLNPKKNNDELYDSIFTHDPSIVINEGSIILNMTKKLRKNEIFEHIDIYKELNIPILGKVVEDGKVEGGDCLWLNNKTLLVGESSRTNINGINQLDNILKKFNIKVIPIKLKNFTNKNSCFHLMSFISMIDHDLVIGYKKLIPDELFQIFKNNNIKLIFIPEDEYINSKTLAVNILALSPRNLVLLSGYEKTNELLIKENCILNLFDGNELCIKAEGGPTCLTRPILRL